METRAKLKELIEKNSEPWVARLPDVDMRKPENMVDHVASEMQKAMERPRKTVMDPDQICAFFSVHELMRRIGLVDDKYHLTKEGIKWYDGFCKEGHYD